MKLQTKASFKKEYLAFFRTKKFMILAFVLIGVAIMNPLLVAGLGLAMNSMSDLYSEFGMDISGLTEALGSSVSAGVAQAIMDISQTGLIVFLLVINSNAGGEQKKRSIMIPRSAGLKSFSYIFPKFILYPLAAFVLAVVASFVAWGVSSLVFTTNDVNPINVLFGGMLTGVCLMFYICTHITIGTATSKTGLSATICILSSLLLPTIFIALGSEAVYNPFTLRVLAGYVVQSGGMESTNPLDVIVTVIITLLIMVILYFVALFAQNAKKIDNSGNEIRI